MGLASSIICLFRHAARDHVDCVTLSYSVRNSENKFVTTIEILADSNYLKLVIAQVLITK